MVVHLIMKQTVSYVRVYIACEHMLATLPCSFTVNNTILYAEIVEWLVQGLNARRAASCTLRHSVMLPVHHNQYVQVHFAAVCSVGKQNTLCALSKRQPRISLCTYSENIGLTLFGIAEAATHGFR